MKRSVARYHDLHRLVTNPRVYSDGSPIDPHGVRECLHHYHENGEITGHEYSHLLQLMRRVENIMEGGLVTV